MKKIRNYNHYLALCRQHGKRRLAHDEYGVFIRVKSNPNNRHLKLNDTH